MSADSVTLLRELVAAVAQPSNRGAATAGLLAAAGYSTPDRYVIVVADDRRGAYFPVSATAPLTLAQLEREFGRGRRHVPLDGSGPDEWTWDITVDANEHVVLTAESEDGSAVLHVMLKPYSMQEPPRNDENPA